MALLYVLLINIMANSNISVRMNSNELFDYTSNEGICYGQVIV